MFRRFAMLPLLALTVASVGASGLAVAGEAGGSVGDLGIWDSESWRRSFTGSYGVNAEIEPRLSATDQATLQELLPLVSGDDTAAAKAAVEAVITPESSAVFDFLLGNLHYQDGELEPAAASYSAAIVKFPSFRRAHRQLGQIYVRLGKFAEALEPLSRAIELGAADGVTYGLLGYAYSQTGRHIAAESAYRTAMLLDPTTEDWKIGLTHSVLRQEKYAEAVSLCRELIERSPDRADFWLMQANAWIGLGKPLQAAENYEIVSRMGKATVDSERILGDIYVNQELWDLAAGAYRRALELDPEQDVSVPLRWCRILAQRGAFAQAGSLLEEISRVYEGRLDDASRREVLKVQARVAMASGEKGERVVRVLEEIVDLDPLDGDALILLGNHFARAGQPQRAILYYERAEALEDYEAVARVRHAQVLVGQSRYAEAVPLLERAQEIRPREDVGRYLDQVQRVARRGT
ncbi:MAG: tetratricopeptide repeat protein [Acidobacteriota bacterium]|nr:tetratricopeptide repeat protein [Acidobacteriota bacterium]